MKGLAGHQPDHLPYLGFFARMLEVDEFVLVDDVQFERKSWQSRNRIRGRGKPILLSVPVATKGRFAQRIDEVEIAAHQPRWAEKHWRSLVHCYGRSPYFAEHHAFFHDTYRRRWTRLVDLNLHLIEYLCAAFELPWPRPRTSELGLRGRKTELLVGLCEAFGAQAYVSGPGGRLYVDEDRLARAGIEHRYSRFEHPVYPQPGSPFVASLSAVDLLFNAGPDASRVLRSSVRHEARAAGALRS